MTTIGKLTITNSYLVPPVSLEVFTDHCFLSTILNLALNYFYSISIRHENAIPVNVMDEKVFKNQILDYTTYHSYGILNYRSLIVGEFKIFDSEITLT